MISTPRPSAFVIALAIAQLAMPQDPKADTAPASRPAPKSGVEALALVRETLAKTRAWSCQCVSSLGARGIASGLGARLSTIWRRDAEGNVTGLRVTGTFNGGPTIDAASDGTTMRVVDPERKSYEEGPWSAQAAAEKGPGESGVIDVLRFALPIELWRPGGLERARGGGVILGDTMTLDGALCDVIELHEKFDAPEGSGPGAAAGTVTRVIAGRDDRLIRRIRKTFISPQSPSDAENVYDLTEWKLDVEVTDATFTVDVTGHQRGRIAMPKGARAGQPPPGGGRPAGIPRIELKKGDRPPDFTLKDLSGKEHKLSAYKGRVVFVHFSVLGGLETDEFLTKMKSKYGGQLVVLDLVIDHEGGGAEKIKKNAKPVSFPRIVGGEQVADAWKLNAFPCGITIGPDGKVASTLMTGVAKGKGAEFLLDAYLKRMGEYLKNPEKGW